VSGGARGGEMGADRCGWLSLVDGERGLYFLLAHEGARNNAGLTEKGGGLDDPPITLLQGGDPPEKVLALLELVATRP
jgi:hypothetical protein